MVSQTKKSKKTTSRTSRTPKKKTSSRAPKRKKKGSKKSFSIPKEVVFAILFIFFAFLCAFFLVRYWIAND